MTKVFSSVITLAYSFSNYATLKKLEKNRDDLFISGNIYTTWGVLHSCCGLRVIDGFKELNEVISSSICNVVKVIWGSV